MLAFLIGAPLAGWGTGRWAGSVAPTAAHALQAGEHQVTATLLRNVPAGPDAGLLVSLSWVRARWAGPGASAHTGYVQAPSGSRAGTTVQVWLDRSGKLTASPLPVGQVRGWILMMTVLAPVVLALLLLATMGLIGRIMERRRLAGWHQAWSAIEPQWTRRRH